MMFLINPGHEPGILGQMISLGHWDRNIVIMTILSALAVQDIVIDNLQCNQYRRRCRSDQLFYYYEYKA